MMKNVFTLRLGGGATAAPGPAGSSRSDRSRTATEPLPATRAGTTVRAAATSTTGSASYQLASRTTGTSTATRAMSTRAMPSTPTAYCAPKAGIQECTSVNWKRAPFGTKAAHIPIVTASTTTEVSSASCLTRASRPRGTTPITAAPTSGMIPRTVSVEIPLTCRA